MKYLVLLLVFFGFAWYWRHSREQALKDRRQQPPPSPPPGAPAGPQDMVACTVCGTHVPEKEAIQGNRGIYCSPSHRSQRES